HEDPRLGEGRSHPLDHPVQDPDRPLLGRRIPRSEHVAEKILLALSIEGKKAGNRKITPGVVVTVEEGQLLPAVGRIVRGVKIDPYVFDIAAPQSLAVPLDHTLGQLLAHAVELRPARSWPRV